MIVACCRHGNHDFFLSIHMNAHGCTWMHMHAHACTRMHKYIRAHANAHARMRASTNARARTHVHMHTPYMHTKTLIQLPIGNEQQEPKF